MPAIQPARLKMQTEQLVNIFHRPELFAIAADDLLSLYADRTQRPGQVETGRNLLPTYNTPMPVLQAIMLACKPVARNNPEQAVACCEALWQLPAVEPRILAAQLLGSLPSATPGNQAVIAQLSNWSREVEDDGLRKRVIQEGFRRLASDQPGLILAAVEEFLRSNKSVDIKIGLTMLAALIEHAGMEDLPAFFNLAGAAIRAPHPQCKPQLLDLMTALAVKSPGESAFLFKQTIKGSGSPLTNWLVRQTLLGLHPDLATRIQVLMQNTELD